MPRKSAASLSVVSLDTGPTRLRPPASLSEVERSIFIDVVTNCRANHFQASDMPLLCRYVESAALADLAAGELRRDGPVVGGRPSPWITVQEKAVRALVALSMRLRLSPQARQPNNPKRPEQLSAYEIARLKNEEED
jgi:phage terminase small subunit